MPCCRIACLVGTVALFCATAAHAQLNPNAPVNVLGQVFAPGGGSVTQSIRVNFTSDNATRPPEIVFTDSNGRFVLYSVSPGDGYAVSVDANEPHWALTIVKFMPMGRQPTVQIHLNRYEKPRTESNALSVSMASLRADVPKAARREFEEGMKQVDLGDVGKARKRFEKAIKVYPEFVEARNELAVALMKEGDLAGAETQLRAALQTDSAAVLPLMNLGLCIYRQTRYAEAAAPLERATQLQPENYRAHLLLGMVWVMSGDDPRSEPTLLRAYALGGVRAARAQYYLSHYYTRKKDYRQAARALETYLHDVPNDPAAADLHKTLDRLRATFAKS